MLLFAIGKQPFLLFAMGNSLLEAVIWVKKITELHQLFYKDTSVNRFKIQNRTVHVAKKSENMQSNNQTLKDKSWNPE